MHKVEDRRESTEVPMLNCPVHWQAVPQESLSPRSVEVPFSGRLMHHRAEFLGALAAGKNAADQTLRPAQTRLALPPFFRRIVLLAGLIFDPELQADRKWDRSQNRVLPHFR